MHIRLRRDDGAAHHRRRERSPRHGVNLSGGRRRGTYVRTTPVRLSVRCLRPERTARLVPAGEHAAGEQHGSTPVLLRHKIAPDEDWPSDGPARTPIHMGFLHNFCSTGRVRVRPLSSHPDKTGGEREREGMGGGGERAGGSMEQ